MFLVLIDSAFAFDLPEISAGWIEIVDVETGRARTISRRAYARARRAGAALAGRRAAARPRNSAWTSSRSAWIRRKSDIALSEFVVERRLRKTKA